MGKLKRYVAVVIVLSMLLPIRVNSITAEAKESNKKVYGPVNIESTKLTDKDIPDALIASGELKNEIKEKYVKRLYNEENSMNTLMFEKENGERTMYLFKKPVKYKDENGNIVDKDIKFKEISESYHSELAVLDKYTGQTEFTFLLKLDGYKLAELDDNCLYLENVNNGEIEGIIDSVYMKDNAGVTDFHNYYTYTELKKGEYEITAHVNEEFLTDENTQYPVIIDPTISINKSGNSTGIYDDTLNSTSTTEGALVHYM